MNTKCKILYNQNNGGKTDKTKTGDILFLDFKIYFEVIVLKTA